MDDETEKATVQELRRTERAILRELKGIRLRLIKMDKNIVELARRIDHIKRAVHSLDCY